jgi:spore coat-associated protein N
MKTPSFSSANGALLKTGLGLSLATATLAVTATGAIFTDSTAIGSNAFSTGDVELTTSVTTDLVSFTTPKMVPGDSVVDAVTVTNAGNVELRYAISSATTENALAAQLDLTVWAEAAEPDTAGSNTTCDSTAPATVLYAAGDLGTTAGVNLIGSPTQGSQTGDRTLAATGSEVLCFKVALPTATDSTFENLNSTATFAFAAEQTTNNA